MTKIAFTIAVIVSLGSAAAATAATYKARYQNATYTQQQRVPANFQSNWNVSY